MPSSRHERLYRGPFIGLRGETVRKAYDALDLTTTVLVGQVRSMAVDLLRSTSMNQAEALAALEEVAARDSDDP
jgi:hypothetical protein